MTRRILHFFDKLEDQTRAKLSRVPLIYALIGGIGVILFWRGVWHIADDVSLSSILSIIIGAIILLVTGVFVSAFIGNRLIISGLSGDKKLAEKTADEIQTEEDHLKEIENILKRVEGKVITLESEIHNK